MKQRKLGDLTVSEIGLGCMGMSEFYGATDEAQSLETIRRSLATTFGAFSVTNDLQTDAEVSAAVESAAD